MQGGVVMTEVDSTGVCAEQLPGQELPGDVSISCRLGYSSGQRNPFCHGHHDMRHAGRCWQPMECMPCTTPVT